MNRMQILNQLYAGKRISLAFQSPIESENFRQRMYKLKKQQDDAMSAVLDEERLTLKCRPSTVFDVEGNIKYYKLELWTEEKKSSSYTILSIEEGEKATNAAGSGNTDDDSPIGNAGAPQVSSDLAAPDGGSSRD